MYFENPKILKHFSVSGIRHFYNSNRRWFCLEQLLNKLLRDQHAKDTSLPAPHPTIATMGMTRKQRTAATKPYTRIRIDKMIKVGKSTK